MVPGWVIWAVSAAKGTPLCELYGLNLVPLLLYGFTSLTWRTTQVRGPWAWIGYDWDFCAPMHDMPPELFLDYGDPVGTCVATTPGVYERVFERAVATFDTNTYQGAVTLLPVPQAVPELELAAQE